MKVRDLAIEVALPALERELVANPSPVLRELVEAMREAMRLRAEAYALERETLLGALGAVPLEPAPHE